MVFEIIAIALLASDITSRWYIRLKKPAVPVTAPITQADVKVETVIVKDTEWIEAELKGFEAHLQGIGRTASADAHRLISRLRGLK
jgi:hypothetical protein